MSKPLIERGFWLKRYYKEAHTWMCKKIDKDVMTPPKWHEKPMPILDEDPMMEEPSPPKTPIVSPMEEPEEQCYMGMGLQGVEVKDTSKKVVELVPIHTCVSNMAMVTTRSRRATRHQPPNEGGDPSGSGQPNENTQPPPNQQDGAPQGGGDGGVDAPNDGNDDHGGHDGGENPNGGGGGDDGDDGDDDDDLWDFTDTDTDASESEGDEQAPNLSRGGRPLPHGPLLEATIPPNDDWGEDDEDYDGGEVVMDGLPSEEEVMPSSPSWRDTSDEDDASDVEVPHQAPITTVLPGPPAPLPSEARFTVPPTKPKGFTGLKKKGTESTEVTTWLNKLELYFKMCHLDDSLWVTRAFYLLESPAFEVVKARIKSLTKEGLWTDTWDQFTKLMITHFGDVEQNLAYRAKLHRLVVLDGDILRYTKLFNETVNKITTTLGDEELISDFFKGIKDRNILQDVMIDPKTGGVWKSWTHLYEYVIGKYSVLRYHGEKDKRSRDKRARDYSPRRSRSPKRKTNDRDNNRPFDRNRRDKDKRPHDKDKPRQERDKRDSRPRSEKNPDLKTLDVSKLVLGQRTSKEQREMLAKDNRCFYCFKVGHSKSECRLVKASKSDK